MATSGTSRQVRWPCLMVILACGLFACVASEDRSTTKSMSRQFVASNRTIAAHLGSITEDSLTIVGREIGTSDGGVNGWAIITVSATGEKTGVVDVELSKESGVWRVEKGTLTVDGQRISVDGADAKETTGVVKGSTDPGTTE